MEEHNLYHPQQFPHLMMNGVEGPGSLMEVSPSTSMYPYSGYSPSTHAQAGILTSMERTVSSSSVPQSSPGPDGMSPWLHRRRRIMTPSESQLSTDPSSPVEGRSYPYHHQDWPHNRALSDDNISNGEFNLSQSAGESSQWRAFLRLT